MSCTSSISLQKLNDLSVLSIYIGFLSLPHARHLIFGTLHFKPTAALAESTALLSLTGIHDAEEDIRSPSTLR